MYHLFCQSFNYDNSPTREIKKSNKYNISPCSKKDTNAESAGIIVYLPNYRAKDVIDIQKFDFTNINVIIYCFFRIDDNGEPYSSNTSVDIKKKTIYYLNNDVKKKYPHLRTVLSFGGASGSKNFGTILNSKDKISNIAKKIADTMTTHGFDGVDIDWEFPTDSTQSKNYGTLLKEIRSNIGNNKILTISAAYNSNKYNGYAKTYMNYINWFNIMTYDFAGSWNKYSGHGSPLYSPTNDLNHQKSCDISINSYLNEGIPSNKLVLGVAFSGQAWKVQSSANNGFNQKGTTNTEGQPGNTEGIWTYMALREQNILVSKKMTSKPWFRTWHSDAKSPSLFNPYTMQYISYNDKDSMCERIAYVKMKNLAGVMMWEIGQDYKRELLDSLIFCYTNN
ncbi:glycoside hydrolase [Piromyces finnis]|uniref:Glycoside hydrolase n=1 Tax=Piromyces finnis TaxID=1754191 RepID=A0A1Y1UXT4_9FUNG|nr:glycoside hydrolase [Piromyces finnis]|eukprot:ORX42981.1 glycoside hydrolase [Piromyces finnis]